MSALALTRVGSIVVGIDGHCVTAFFDSGEREADCDLARLLGMPVPSDRPRLLEITHASGTFVLAVHGRVHITPSEGNPRCQRPALVAGAFRRACLRGVTWHDHQLVYMIDVDEVAARLRAPEDKRP